MVLLTGEPGIGKTALLRAVVEHACTRRSLLRRLRSTGHKQDGDPDSTENIGKTRRYIQDFSAAVEKADNFTDLYEAMLAVYPGRVNRAVIWHSAKAFLG
jgi:ABC-type phosphate/phosphonate transport system ATPase subunit